MNANNQQHGISLLRVALGLMWVAHALLKVFVFTLPGTAQFFESIGIPGALAYPVVAAEFFGGMALILGVYARQIAVLMIPLMIAAATVHIPNGWLFSAPGGGWEYPAFLVISSLALWLIGDGSFALRRSSRFTLA